VAVNVDLAGHQVDPGSGIEKGPVNRGLDGFHFVQSSQPFRAAMDQDPDTGQVGIGLAPSVHGPAAWAIAKHFGASHGAGECGCADNALSAHAAVKNWSLDGSFKQHKKSVKVILQRALHGASPERAICGFE